MSTPRTESSSKRTAKPRNTTTAAPKRVLSVADMSITDDERERMIREAAYYRAERRGFAPGDEMSDWLAAESEVLELIEIKPRA